MKLLYAVLVGIATGLVVWVIGQLILAIGLPVIAGIFITLAVPVGILAAIYWFVAGRAIV